MRGRGGTPCVCQDTMPVLNTLAVQNNLVVQYKAVK